MTKCAVKDYINAKEDKCVIEPSIDKVAHCSSFKVINRTRNVMDWVLK